MLTAADTAKLFGALIANGVQDEMIAIDPYPIYPPVEHLATVLQAAGLPVDRTGASACYHTVGWDDARMMPRMSVSDAYIRNRGRTRYGAPTRAIVCLNSLVGQFTDPVMSIVADMILGYVCNPNGWKQDVLAMLDELAKLPSGVTQFVLISDIHEFVGDDTVYTLTRGTIALAEVLKKDYPSTPVVDETATGRLVGVSTTGIVVRVGFSEVTDAQTVAVFENNEFVGSVGF